MVLSVVLVFGCVSRTKFGAFTYVVARSSCMGQTNEDLMAGRIRSSISQPLDRSAVEPVPCAPRMRHYSLIVYFTSV